MKPTPTPRWRSLVSRAIAVVLTAGTLPALAAATAAPAHAATTSITAGSGLDWGLKASWRNYIGPAGTTLLGDATRNDDGTFHFPVTGGSYESDTQSTIVQFGGGVEFLGHCHGAGGTHARPCDLDMTLTDLRIEITEDHASLFVDSTSRPIEGGDPVVDQDVPLVDLDIEEAEPAIAGGKTTWSDLTAAITLDGSRILTYGLGTVVDPVTFGYDGPGGKPAGETWDAPGVTSLVPTDAETQPATIAQRIVGRLSAEEVVAWRQGSVAILDAETLEPRSQWLSGVSDPGEIIRDSVAIDPVTQTIFAAEATTNPGDRKLVTYSWDGTELSVTLVKDSYDATLVHDSGSAGTWDAAGNRYVITRASANAANALWEVVKSDDTWTARKLGPISAPNPGAGNFNNYFVNLEAVPDGNGRSALLGTTLFGAGKVVRISRDGAGYRSEPLAEAGDINADRLFATKNGFWAVAGNDKALFVPFVGYADNRRLGTASDPIAFTVPSDSNRNLSTVAADIDTDALIGVTDQNTRITLLRAGEREYAGTLGTSYAGTVLGLTADGRIRGQVGEALQVFDIAGISPQFVAEPTGATADLTGESASITLATEVTGTPEPTLTWQSRIPGQAWEEIGDGSTALTTTVTAADAGRQYRAIAENASGRVASNRVPLELRTPPAITIQPADVSVAPGDTAQLKVMPQGNPDPDVQWQQRFSGVWHDVPGATEPTLELKDADTDLDGAQFRARLSNDLGQVTSGRATVSVAEASTAPRKITAGHVDWGVKQSFRSYITGPIAHGKIEFSDGVEQREDGTFRFTATSGRYESSGTSTVQLGGSIRFTGHQTDGAPLLDLSISDLRVVLGADGSRLVADVASRGLEDGELRQYDDVALADLESGSGISVSGDVLRLSDVPATLSTDGAPAFAGFYEPGTALDPVSASLDLGEEILEPAAVESRTAVTLGHASYAYGSTTTAAVAVTASGTTPTGAVTVRVAGKTLTGRLVNGRATVALPKSLTPGTRVVTARYAGSVAVKASAASTSLRVTKAKPSIRLKLSKSRVSAKSRARAKITVAIPGGSNVRPTGQIVVRDGGKVIATKTLKAGHRGSVTVRLPKLKRGKHYLRATIGSTSLHSSRSTSYRSLRVR